MTFSTFERCKCTSGHSMHNLKSLMRLLAQSSMTPVATGSWIMISLKVVQRSTHVWKLFTGCSVSIERVLCHKRQCGYHIFDFSRNVNTPHRGDCRWSSSHFWQRSVFMLYLSECFNATENISNAKWAAATNEGESIDFSAYEKKTQINFAQQQSIIIELCHRVISLCSPSQQASATTFILFFSLFPSVSIRITYYG